MRRLAVLAAAAAVIACFPALAQARTMPASLGKSSIEKDARKAKGEVDWPGALDYGKCESYSPSRYECQVELEGKHRVKNDAGRGTIFEFHYCSWVAWARWRGEYIVVGRREVKCDDWTEPTR